MSTYAKLLMKVGDLVRVGPSLVGVYLIIDRLDKLGEDGKPLWVLHNDDGYLPMQESWMQLLEK
jgi:hypothetical protein